MSAAGAAPPLVVGLVPLWSETMARKAAVSGLASGRLAEPCDAAAAAAVGVGVGTGVRPVRNADTSKPCCDAEAEGAPSIAGLSGPSRNDVTQMEGLLFAGAVSAVMPGNDALSAPAPAPVPDPVPATALRTGRGAPSGVWPGVRAVLLLLLPPLPLPEPSAEPELDTDPRSPRWPRRAGVRGWMRAMHCDEGDGGCGCGWSPDRHADLLAGCG